MPPASVLSGRVPLAVPNRGEPQAVNHPGEPHGGTHWGSKRLGQGEATPLGRLERPRLRGLAGTHSHKTTEGRGSLPAPPSYC